MEREGGRERSEREFACLCACACACSCLCACVCACMRISAFDERMVDTDRSRVHDKQNSMHTMHMVCTISIHTIHKVCTSVHVENRK